MNLFGLVPKLQQVKFLLQDHSPTILTGVGVSGTVATAYLTGRASFKAARLIDREELIVNTEVKMKDPSYLGTTQRALQDPVHLSKTQKVKLVWKLYVPPVGIGATTIASIIMANKISSARLAALGVAAGISERALQEYKDKVFEKLGEKQERNVRDEIAQDRVNQNPVNQQVVVTGTGQVLCYDMHTGRYFQSSMEDIKRAENKINHDLVNYMQASASEFYDEIGLPATTYTDSVGWNTNNRIELNFSTTMSPDGRPCIAIDFVRPPTMEYHRMGEVH
jgi:hypothetical protein